MTSAPSSIDSRPDLRRCRPAPALGTRRRWRRFSPGDRVVDPGDPGIDVDLFAGGGGASLGKLWATGRSPDVAVNHWVGAIAMHSANHPETRHLLEDVYAVDPIEVCGDRRVRMLWASPTCTHFSRAKGRALRDRKIRGLAWAIIPWIHRVRPEVIILENVVEFLTWGPVSRVHDDGCCGDGDGVGCERSCGYGMPIRARAGETFAAWRKKILNYGYSLEHRKIAACDYGSPTTRERLYVVMRADGRPHDWPAPTHARVPTAQRPQRWRTAAEDVIDWSIPVPSLFDRRKPFKPPTERRLVRGLSKYVLAPEARPFLFMTTHGGRAHDVDDPVRTVTGAHRGEINLVSPMVMKTKTYGGGGNDARPADRPVGTVLGSSRGELAVGAAYMIHVSNGERPGQLPRIYDVRAPHPAVVAEGRKTAVGAAFLALHYSERREGEVMGVPVDEPTRAVTARDHHALVAANLVKLHGTSTVAEVSEPLHAVLASGTHHALSAAYLTRYNGQSVGQQPDVPVGTLDARDRYGLVEVDLAALPTWTPEIAGRAHQVYDLCVRHGYDGPGLDHDLRIVTLVASGHVLVVYDLGMRMLVPRELFRANGFPDTYAIDPRVPVAPRRGAKGAKGARGARARAEVKFKTMTRTDQVRAVGNSVCPHVAEALVRSAIATRGPASYAE